MSIVCFLSVYPEAWSNYIRELTCYEIYLKMRCRETRGGARDRPPSRGVPGRINGGRSRPAACDECQIAFSEPFACCAVVERG